eukprot:GHVU01002605.1.p1 GENE.GHVU01002605.1~~GHVU01002605.1.p1  ORF type:complete len:113 (+),score=10.72 GHVU01002605.1:294-632(+)
MSLRLFILITDESSASDDANTRLGHTHYCSRPLPASIAPPAYPLAPPADAPLHPHAPPADAHDPLRLRSIHGGRGCGYGRTFARTPSPRPCAHAIRGVYIFVICCVIDRMNE